MHPRLIEFFTKSYEPPWMCAHELFETGASDLRTLLEGAIAAVNPHQLAALGADNALHADFSLRFVDQSDRRRCMVVLLGINEEIQNRRRELICAPISSSLEPYSHKALSDISVDEEGLVALDAFALKGDALVRNGVAFFMAPPVPSSNACYWLLEALSKHGLESTVRVRLDPLLWGPVGEFAGRMYRSTIYGQPLDWERLVALSATEHGQWMPTSDRPDSLRTDYAWVPQGSELAFLCEELPLAEEVGTRAGRYLHAIYNKTSGSLAHLDGAVRIYTADDLTARTASKVHRAGKVGKRVKLFRTDAPVSREALGDIAQAFFMWNYDVARYFGARIPEGF